MINTTHAQDDRELIQSLNAGRNHAKTIATIKIELRAHRATLHRQRSQPHLTQDPMQSSRQAIALTELTENAVREVKKISLVGINLGGLMSDGKTHDLSIWAIAPLVGLGVYAFVPNDKIESAIVAIAGHLIGGLMLSPDLDLPSRPWRRWGWFRIIWIPYQKVTRHRGVSHAPFIGMLLRVLYLALPVIAFVIYRGMDQWILLFLQAHWTAIAIFWLGLELSVWVHLVLDGILLKKLRG